MKITKIAYIAVLSWLISSLGFAGETTNTVGDNANLLKSWKKYAKNTDNKDAVITVIKEDGIIYCENKELNVKNGVFQRATLNQSDATPIFFSAESKAQDVSGKSQAGNYGIYLDITYADGTNTYGEVVPFNTGTHDWEIASLSYAPEKPVKSISYKLVFRKKTGKVWFRNPILKQEKK